MIRIFLRVSPRSTFEQQAADVHGSRRRPESNPRETHLSRKEDSGPLNAFKDTEKDPISRLSWKKFSQRARRNRIRSFSIACCRQLEEEKSMPCFVPFHGRNLDTSFFAFKPVGVLVDELMEALKHFSLCAEYHGCAYSCVLQSIHGNLIIWYGAWIKRSSEKRELLSATLISELDNVSSLAILLDYGFFEPYAGESKEGHQMARFSTGDTVTMTSMIPGSDDLADLSYACLALLRSCFLKMDGVRSGVCLRCYDRPRVAGLHVWKSLQACYSWLLTSNFRKTVSPYINHLSVDAKYDVFRVVYVNCDEVVNLKFLPQQMLAFGGEASENEGSFEE